tara:strand:+ start:3934 stop:4425 length:492 start_codon:yes stop_codon:yes gene_type:complete
MYLYKIKCLTSDDFYIGSTCNFKRRTYEHRTRFKCNVRNQNDKLYDFMRINGGLDNFTFEILFTFDNINKKDLKIKENKLITDLKPSLNAIKSFNTKEEYNQHSRNSSNNYRKAHPEKVKKYQEEYRNKKVICDCGKTYTLSHKIRHLKSTYHSKHSKINLIV